MPGSNEFKTFATGGGANVLSPSAYAALTGLLSSGYQSGTANSTQMNTTWRQAAFVAASIAQAIADMTGVAVLDDGVVANFVNQFLGMLQRAPYCNSTVGGTADAVTVSHTPALISLSTGIIIWKATGPNTVTNPTLKRDSNALKTIIKGNGLPLAVGDIPGAGALMLSQYDAALDAEVLLNPATGVSLAGILASNNNTFTKAQRGAVSALTDAATISLDLALANNYSITLGGNRTLANPTNVVAGQSGIIAVTQDATGSRTLAFASNYKFSGGVAPALTTTANAIDYLTYYVETPSRVFISKIPDIK